MDSDFVGYEMMWVPGEIKKGPPLYRGSLVLCFTDGGRLACVYKQPIDALYPVHERDITEPGEKIGEFFFEERAMAAVKNTLGVDFVSSDLKWVYLFDQPGYTERHGPIEGRKNDCFEKMYVLRRLMPERKAEEIIDNMQRIAETEKGWIKSPMLVPVSEIDHDMVKEGKELRGVRLDYSLKWAQEYYNALREGRIDELPVEAWSQSHPEVMLSSAARWR